MPNAPKIVAGEYIHEERPRRETSCSAFPHLDKLLSLYYQELFVPNITSVPFGKELIELGPKSENRLKNFKSGGKNLSNQQSALSSLEGVAKLEKLGKL